MAGSDQGVAGTARHDAVRTSDLRAARPDPGELAEQASRSIREDDSLTPGDVASTDQGLFRFQGSPLKERQPEDFVRIR
jgi:hypothetical protein